MQGHVCGDVFDMCWACGGAVWLKPQQRSRKQPAADLPVKTAAAAAAALRSAHTATTVSVCI